MEPDHVLMRKELILENLDKCFLSEAETYYLSKSLSDNVNTYKMCLY